jgi:preprotein translocase subunit SecF
MGFLRKKAVIVIAVLLLVIGAGTAFAATGITLDFSGNTVYISNSNSQPYDVTVQITYSANGISGQQAQRKANVRGGAVRVPAITIGSSAIIERAEVISASPGL